MKRFVLLVSLVAALLSGCSSSDTAKYDLDTIDGKVTTGMSEVQVVSAIGAPSHVSKQGDSRELRYDSIDGKGHLLVKLKGNIVVDSVRTQ